MNQLTVPLRLNANVVLKNRFAVAPMTTTQCHADGRLSADESAWLLRLAEDGYGLVISCAAAISLDSIAFPNQMSVQHDALLPALQALARRMKRQHSINLIQLCHAGSRAIKSTPLSASSYDMPHIAGFVVPQALTCPQIDNIVADFAAACARVAKAGFDGVEFHGANGYLFTQFISTMTNLRQDQYGGSLENRARLARQVVQACRKAVPQDFILGFRLSFENSGPETGLDIDENIQIAHWLAEDGIDYIHTSQLDYRATSIKYPEKIALSHIRENIGSLSLPLIGVGSINDSHAAHEAMAFGADIVAIGRAAIGNKDVPKILGEGAALPYQNPFAESHLKDLGISQNFIDYLRKMPVASLNVVI